MCAILIPNPSYDDLVLSFTDKLQPQFPMGKRTDKPG